MTENASPIMLSYTREHMNMFLYMILSVKRIALENIANSPAILPKHGQRMDDELRSGEPERKADPLLM